MTDDELAAIDKRAKVTPAEKWSYELSLSYPTAPLTGDPTQLAIATEAAQRAHLLVVAGDTTVLRIEDGKNTMTTEPHLSSWLHAVEDRARLLEALHDCREQLAEAEAYGEECLRRMGGTW